MGGCISSLLPTPNSWYAEEARLALASIESTPESVYTKNVRMYARLASEASRLQHHPDMRGWYITLHDGHNFEMPMRATRGFTLREANAIIAKKKWDPATCTVMQWGHFHRTHSS